MPACSSPARTAAARSAAPGVSPCTQIVSTFKENVEPSRAATLRSRTIRTARSAAWPGSDTTAPATCRGVNEPSFSYERSANPSAATERPSRDAAERSSDPGNPTSTERVVERRDRPRDRLGRVGAPDAHVVHRAVRLDVPKHGTFGLRDGAERAELIENEIGDLSEARWTSRGVRSRRDREILDVRQSIRLLAPPGERCDASPSDRPREIRTRCCRT